MDFFSQFIEGIDGIPSTSFYWKKIGKKMRLIGEPNKPMREVQTRIVDFLRSLAPRFHSAVACKYGIGSVRNARTHTQKDFIFKLDFSNAFESIDGKVLSDIIAKRVAKYSSRGVEIPSAEEWLSFLSCYALRRNGALIQGAVTSSFLFDWYCEVMINKSVRKLMYEEYGYSYSKKITFTQYVDDLVFTAKQQYGGTPNPITHALRRSIRALIFKVGFVENPRKTVVAKFEVHGSIPVTGVNIGAFGQIGIGRKKTKEIERILTLAIEMPLFAEKPDVIKGRVNYLLDVLRGKKELNQLEKRTLEKYIQWCRMSGIDSRWAENTLRNKPPKKIRRKRQRVRSKPK